MLMEKGYYAMSDDKILHEDLFNFLLNDVNAPFSGWDFSHIISTGRMVEAPLTWSYGSILLRELRNTPSLLDMGTGGGEYLSSLQPLPPYTFATEGYVPNVPIARSRLEPLGVKVYEARGNSTTLPFVDNQFDLIINRHEAYSAREVYRILKPGCHFITQQVGGSNNADLNLLFNAPLYQYAFWQLDYAVQELRDAGTLSHKKKIVQSHASLISVLLSTTLKLYPGRWPIFQLRSISTSWWIFITGYNKNTTLMFIPIAF